MNARTDAGGGLLQTPAGWPVYRIGLIKSSFLFFQRRGGNLWWIKLELFRRAAEKTKRGPFEVDLCYKQATPLGFVSPDTNHFGEQILVALDILVRPGVIINQQQPPLPNSRQISRELTDENPLPFPSQHCNSPNHSQATMNMFRLLLSRSGFLSSSRFKISPYPRSPAKSAVKYPMFFSAFFASLRC
jgi:hypothetical protein